MPRKTPYRRLDAILLLEFARPKEFAAHRLQADEIALRAERINLALADRRRHPRPHGIANGVRTFVFVFPQHFAVRLPQANHPLETSAGVRRIYAVLE